MRELRIHDQIKTKRILCNCWHFMLKWEILMLSFFLIHSNVYILFIKFFKSFMINSGTAWNLKHVRIYIMQWYQADKYTNQAFYILKQSERLFHVIRMLMNGPLKYTCAS